MNKELLIKCLKEGKSTRDMERILSKKRSTISYWIKKYDLQHLQKYKKNNNYLFDKIDTKEKAYMLGFILGDGHISQSYDVEITVSMKDKEIVEYISKIIDANVMYDNTFDKTSRKYPSATSKKRIKDIIKFTGGRLKKERHYPRVRKDLERYLLLGFFDADGCITWGRRKDRNRLWHKISFTSQLKLLEGVQQMLLNNIDISTALRPKSNENCYVLEFANREDVIKFIDYIYEDDFVVLKRKHLKAKALRLELEEFGGTTTR